MAEDERKLEREGTTEGKQDTPPEEESESGFLTEDGDRLVTEEGDPLIQE